MQDSNFSNNGKNKSILFAAECSNVGSDTCHKTASCLDACPSHVRSQAQPLGMGHVQERMA